eukprot:1731347-Prymnesium_polylepis.2
MADGPAARDLRSDICARRWALCASQPSTLTARWLSAGSERIESLGRLAARVAQASTRRRHADPDEHEACVTTSSSACGVRRVCYGDL